jgi:formate-dependent nitrite reductase membrane component NrfD
MQTRQWMTTHEWMVKPMPQKEWIERRGVLVWISEVCTGLGAGLYLVSLLMNNRWGMAIGWLIIMGLKLPVHIAYFGKPLRFWRTMPPFSNAWKTSWSARGVAFTMFFTIFALLQMPLWHPAIKEFFGPAATPLYWVLGSVAGLFALLTGTYSGFIMNSCKGVAFWNTGILPVFFPIAGIADGLGLILAVGLAGGDVNIAAAETWSRVVLLVNAFILITYFVITSRTSDVGRLSVRRLIAGQFAGVFWVGLIILGIMVPLAISISSLYVSADVSSLMLITAIVCHTIGAFSLKYCLLKGGIHQPIISKGTAC